MTWKILKEDKTSIKKIEKDFKHAVDLIDDVISSGAKTGFDEDAVYDAWGKVKDFAKKGLITDKYMQKWEHKK